MTTFYWDKAKCPICKANVEFAALGSTNAFGSMDLDTRPPEMERSTMCYWLVECPECGYVAGDMKKAAPVKRAFVDAEAYKNCEGHVFRNNLSEAFYKHYMITRSTGNLRAEIFALLHTIWTCDDKGDENAGALRAQLVRKIDEYNGKEYDENLDVMKMDLLRRSGSFETLIEEYKNKQFSSKLLNDIRRFQVHKAEEKDTGWYRVQDAIEFCQEQ